MNIRSEKDAQNSVLLDTEKIRRARVLLIGAGGLGAPVAVNLASAGIGSLTVCDFDTVSPSNLNRQFLYTPDDVGKDKATLSAQRLSAFAPDCEIRALSRKIGSSNAEEIIKNSDMVILACDNTKTRLEVNRACVKGGVPLLNCGIAGAGGGIYLYIPEKTPCLACFTEEGDESADKRTLGAAAGIIGGFAATVALRALSGEYDKNAGVLTIIDTVSGTADKLLIHKKSNCKICGGDLNAR